jgi:hypothetical protein
LRPRIARYRSTLGNLVDHAAPEQQALLERLQEQQVTEQALLTTYNEIYGGKTTIDEVHVRLILLGGEADAAKAQARVQAGEDFATVAREKSRDPSAVAFSLKPQETTPRHDRSAPAAAGTLSRLNNEAAFRGPLLIRSGMN